MDGNEEGSADIEAPRDVVQEDSVQVLQKPIQEDVRQLLNQEEEYHETVPELLDEVEQRQEATVSEESPAHDHDEEEAPDGQTIKLGEESARADLHRIPEGEEITSVKHIQTIDEPLQPQLAREDLVMEADNPLYHEKPLSNATSISSHSDINIFQEPVTTPLKPEVPTNPIKTPKILLQSRHLPTDKSQDIMSPSGSPQIGTSLLRRESLRRRESPSTKRELRKSRSPKKRITLSRRDTLQEREILQKVISETSEGQAAGLQQDALSTTASLDVKSAVEGKNHIIDEEIAVSDPNEANPECDYVDSKSPPLTSDDVTAAETSIDVKADVKSPQLPIKANDDDTAISIVASEQVEINGARGGIAGQVKSGQVEDIIEPVEAKEIPHARRSQSAARFSDDTSMLREFLNRAQASKAAKTPVLLPLDADEPQISPRRSPRKAYSPQKSAFISPTRHPGDLTKRHSTPPREQIDDHMDPDDGDGTTATPTSCRRSTRTRLPAPAKTPPGAPSFIPVRRADGTDPVVLQKSQAQELAMVTRANTRRNKGQSKPPLLALKDLPVDAAEVLDTAGQRTEIRKSVNWAKTIASYQEPKEKAEEMDETKGKVRRMRGLGGINGTPAPKKTTTVVTSSNGTPAPKRRSKNR